VDHLVDLVDLLLINLSSSLSMSTRSPSLDLPTLKELAQARARCSSSPFNNIARSFLRPLERRSSLRLLIYSRHCGNKSRSGQRGSFTNPFTHEE
jgi:hypothetical protein